MNLRDDASQSRCVQEFDLRDGFVAFLSVPDGCIGLGRSKQVLSGSQVPCLHPILRLNVKLGPEVDQKQKARQANGVVKVLRDQSLQDLTFMDLLRYFFQLFLLPAVEEGIFNFKKLKKGFDRELDAFLSRLDAFG